MQHKLNKIERRICVRVNENQEKRSGINKLRLIEDQMLFCKVNNIYPYKHFLNTDWSDEQYTINQNNRNYHIDEVVTLSSFEWKLSIKLGIKRNRASRKAGLRNMKQSRGGDWFIEYNGLAGELAYGKLMDIYPYEQLEIRPRKTLEDRGDYVHRNGVRTDVKTTIYKSGRLGVSDWKPNIGIDVFALLIGNAEMGKEYQLKGFAYCEDAVSKDRYKSYDEKTPKPNSKRKRKEPPALSIVQEKQAEKKKKSFISEQWQLTDWDAVLQKVQKLPHVIT